MKALVTGANGLIGANLLRALLRDGHEPVAFVRTTSDVTHIATLPVSFVTGDVHDRASLDAALRGCDMVFHTAVHFAYWGHSADDLARTAIDGTCNLLTAAHDAGIGRVVMTSSSVTLGASYKPDIRDERDSAQAGADEPGYVGAKISQERAALELAEKLGIALVLACPTMSVGPFGAALGPSNAMITSYLADPLRLSWSGGCNIVSVHDVAQGHVILAEKGEAGERYVLGSENLSWRQIHEDIARLAGVPPPGPNTSATACYWIALAQEARALLTGKAPLATREQARMVGRYYWYRHEKAAALGYAPRPAHDALAEAIAWLAASPHVSRETRMGMRLGRAVVAARSTHADDGRRAAT